MNSMSQRRGSDKRGQFRRGLSWILACSCLAMARVSIAADVFQVEEDWQLVVGDADPENNGPQVTCTISPADMQTAYCAFDINYRTQPTYAAGGLQLHTWDPVDPVAVVDSAHTDAMATVGETVTWTTRMSLSDGRVTFRVANGQSQTWGSFGGDDDNLVLSLPTQLENLNAYDPNVSLDNSGVSYAGNRVLSLMLNAVRWYDASGKLIQQTTTPQTVHPQD